ncbi:unnamed protein product, partial [Polarella glacialis]
ADVGFGRSTFLAPAAARLRGALRSARVPADLQRHEVGPGGEVLHLLSLGLPQGADIEGQSVGASSSRGSREVSKRRREDRGSPPTRDAPWTAAVYTSGPGRQDLAQRLLASELRVPPSALRIKGSLHAPGVSVQMVTLPRGLPESVLRAPSEALSAGLLRSTTHPLVVAIGAADMQTPESTGRGDRGARGTPTRRKGPQEAWRCEGQRYTVVLRGINLQEAQGGLLEENLERLTDEGFINLFELSSFGLAEVRRYEVGAALWSGHWDLAARLLLTANRSREGLLQAASDAFAAGDLKQGLELLPEGPQAGCDGLRALAMQLLLRRPALEALQTAVPAAVWARHLSAVGRLAWNRAVSARFAGDLPLRPVAGDLVWDKSAGEARPLRGQELQDGGGDWRLSDVVLPVPRLGEAVPECSGRLHLEAALRQLVPGTDAPAAAFPFEAAKLLPPVRRVVGLPTDLGWDIVEAGAGAVVDCDLTRLRGTGSEEELPQSTEAQPRGRRSASSRRGGSAGEGSGSISDGFGGMAGPALRLRFSLPRSESAEGVLRELLRANPSEFQEGLGRQDETF